MQILPLYKYHSKRGIGWIMILKEEPILRTVYTNTKTPKFTPVKADRTQLHDSSGTILGFFDSDMTAILERHAKLD